MRGLQGVAYAAWGKRIERNYPLNHNQNYNGKSLDAQVIKQATEGRERDIYIHVCGISAELLDGKHHGCPHPNCPNGPGKDRFRCRIELDGMPLHCNQDFSEKNSDVIAAVQWMRNCTFPEALRLIADYLGINPNGDNAASQPKEKKPPFDRNNIVAEYHYTDAVGELVYKVLRDVHKNFMQGRPDPNNPGKWIWNLQYVKRVPYGLPMLLDENRCNVYIVEGEKDADNLNQLFYDCGKSDCVATTSAGGSNSASKWPGFIDEYNLADRRVFVMPDNDEPGLTFGRAVCKAFHDANCNSVKMVSLPVKDISDLIELRRSEGKQPDEIFQEIETLCQQAEPVTDATVTRWNADANTPMDKGKADKKHRAVVISFDEIEERETEWLWDNKIPAGELCLLSGLAGQGKTFWTCYLSAIISNGWNWPDGTPCPQGNVLFFRGEDSIEKTVKPRLRANGANVSRVMLLNGIEDDTALTLHHVDVIRDAINQPQQKNGLPVRLVIIDPMADYMGDTKENSNCEVRSVLKRLKAIAEETGVTFLLIQHTGKADRDNMQQRVLGSTGIVASCRASFCLFTDKETGNRIFAPMKNNLAVDPTSVVFTIDASVRGGQVQVIDWELRKSADDIADEMREAYQHGRGRKPKESSEAENWLHDFLSDGRKPVGNEDDPASGTVRCESEQAGHSWATIRRVQKSLGVTSKKDCGVYFWSLPNFPILSSEVAQNSFQENQVVQNAIPATGGIESQIIANNDETSLLAQNAIYIGNFEQLEQQDDSKQKTRKTLNSVLNSKSGNTDENGRHKVKAQRRPKGKPQPEPETGVTPCDKQQELF